jgi:protein TonB
MAGGGGQQLDTISVTIVSSNVLEAREAERVQPSAAAAAATVEATDGASSSAAAAERHEEKTERKERNSEQQKPVEEPVLAREGITQAPQPAQPQRQANAAAAAAGGAAARSDSASDAKPSAAAAAASVGAVREYARYVALALAKTKPKGVGGLGTVRIKFSIAADGALTAAEIAKSSGSKRLDDLALEAVRRAAFPLPPRGMSAAQLSYEVPYHFR